MTAKIAIEAALTGHLVFATMHTNNAIESLTRLIEIGIEPYLVAPSLVGILAQRLVRKIRKGSYAKYATTVRKNIGSIPLLETACFIIKKNETYFSIEAKAAQIVIIPDIQAGWPFMKFLLPVKR